MASSSPHPSLARVLSDILSRCVQQLVDSHHVEAPPRSELHLALQSYLYSFLSDASSPYRQYFEPYAPAPGQAPNIPEQLNSRQRAFVRDDEDDGDEDQAGWTLAGAQAKSDTSGLAVEYSRARKGKPCGHVFKRGESVYRCKECGLDDSCVLCAKCYRASDHEGHDVSFSMHSGGCGCCDCGDPEAWKEEPDCAYHHHAVPYPEDSEPSGSSHSEATTQQLVPEELVELMRYRFCEALDFIIGTVGSFPNTTVAPPDEQHVARIKPGVRLEPLDNEQSFDKFSGPWSVIMWNDEKHSYEQVIAQLVTSTQCSHSHALAAATRVDKYGLEVVASSTNASRVWRIANIIGRIELGVTVCTSRDAVLLNVVGVLLDWLQDMVKVRMGGDEIVLGRILAGVLLSEGRLATLLALEDRLWKQARAALRTTLMALLVVGQDCKIELGAQYASVYPKLMSSYLLVDREPENSVTQFSVQLFSAPSVATHLVTTQGFLSILLQILYSFFTQQHIAANGEKRIAVPPSSEHPAVDPDSSSFRHKRYTYLFSDLNHIISHPGVQQYLVDQADESFQALLAFLDLFTYMNTIVRASAVHVEYETESWVTAFNLTIQLSKMARNIGKAWHSPDVPVSPKNFVSAAIQLVRAMADSHKGGSMEDMQTHIVQFAGRDWQVANFQVSKEHVSFHHPLHLLYSEMMKGLRGWNRESIRSSTEGHCDSYARLLQVQQANGQNPFIHILETSIKVFALLAQIRAGLWVRNGFGVRAQHLHYREYTLRENTFDQDLYFLQTAFVSIDPSFVLVSMLDRFELLPILAGNIENTVYDRAQGIAVLEELLYLLIMVFSEPSDIEAMTPIDMVRRELKHILFLGPYSYSEVIKNVTERVGEETCFDSVVREVADFRAPDPTTVTSDVGGVYSLKREYYSDIDPYYHRYNRNQREEAAKALKAHFKNDGVFKPRKLLLQGAFAEENAFTSTLTTETFFTLVRTALDTAMVASDYAETVVDYCLHLISIALTEHEERASACAVETSVVERLCRVEEAEEVKELHPRVNHILSILSRHCPEALVPFRKKGTSVATEELASTKDAEQKRLAAKARQAAIMQQFAAASKSFLDEHDDSEGDEDDNEDLADSERPEAAHGLQEVDDGDTSGYTIGSAAQGAAAIRRRKKLAMGSCIVCQEELSAAKPFGILGLIQTSSLVRVSPQDATHLEEEITVPKDLDEDAELFRPFGLSGKAIDEKAGRGTSVPFPRSTKKGLHASACGHMMHISCFETYSASIAQRHAQQLTRSQPENTERREFICPLCKSLGNVLLPLSDDDFEDDLPPSAGLAGAPDEWLRQVIDSTAADQDLPNALSMLARNGNGTLRAWRIIEQLPTPPISFAFSTLAQAERHMLERLVQVVSPLDTESRILDATNTDGGSSRLVSQELLAYTVSVVEITLRGKQTGTLSPGSVPDPTSKLLRSLLSALDRLAVLSAGTPRGTDFARLALLWTMFGQRTATQNHQHFLNRDPFTLLVEFAAISPNEFYQFVALLFYAQILRVSHKLYIDQVNGKNPPLDIITEPDTESLRDFCFSLQESRWARWGGPVTDSMRQSAWSSFGRVRAHMLPFLRRAAILHNVLFTYALSVKPVQGSEFMRLMSLLRIPYPRDLFGRRHGKSAHRTTSLASIIETWDATWRQPSYDYLQPKVEHMIQLEHPTIYELVGLPKRIDTLIESLVSRKCQRCRQVPTDPAICLLCGELVCQQSYCCIDTEPGEEAIHGECNTHMWECGTSTGIYFLVKKCVLIYLYADKGTFATAPYLDSHGEADPGLRKHRPLYLNQARYDEVRKNWLNHTIATVVARKLESGNDSGGWSTF